MDIDFNLFLVRPRVADQCDFDMWDSFRPPIYLGLRVHNDIGRRGLLDPHEFLGVYRSSNFQTGNTRQKLPFYRPTNPNTAAQQANRSRFADAADSWNALSDSQKESYNVRARPLSITGYNLFLKETLNT